MLQYQKNKKKKCTMVYAHGKKVGKITVEDEKFIFTADKNGATIMCVDYEPLQETLEKYYA